MAKIIDPKTLRTATPEEVKAARRRMAQQGPPMDPNIITAQSLAMTGQLLAGLGNRMEAAQTPAPPALRRLLTQVHMQTGGLLAGTVELMTQAEEAAAKAALEPKAEAETKEAPEAKETTDDGTQAQEPNGDGDTGRAGTDGDEKPA